MGAAAGGLEALDKFLAHMPADRGMAFVLVTHLVGNRQWDIPELRRLLEEILPGKTTFEAYRVDHDFPDIGPRTFLLNARKIIPDDNNPSLILLAMEDITRRGLSQSPPRDS